MTKKWLGSWPANCDLCGVPLNTETITFFVDGRTDTSHWALMCPYCHRLHGDGIGTGRGQKYDSKTLEKVEG
jgi:hypothetical protein